MTLKVLVFAEYGWLNGGENSLLSVAQCLRDEFEFVVACPKPSELSESAETLGIRSIQWKLHTTNGRRKSQPEIRTEIQHLIDQVLPDVIHANSLSTSRLVGPVTHGQRPCLGYMRDIIKISHQAVADINQCDQLIVVSQATKDFHVAQGISADKCRVVHNGVDLNEFRPVHSNGWLHRELGLKADTRIILCVGQIGLRKGTDTVLQAYQILRQLRTDLALLLIGIRNSQKEESVQFEKRCRAICGEPDQAFWLGRRSDVAAIMQESNLLLHGARQEPLGRVLLESLAAGLPLVATNVGGTSEIIPLEWHDQLTCPPDNPQSMADKAMGLLGNQDLAERVAEAIRRESQNRFDVAQCAQTIAKNYKRLAGT